MFLCCAAANAGDLVVRVTDVSSGDKSYFRVESKPLDSTKISPVEGAPLNQISKYAARGGKLVAGGVALTDAEEILFQCTKGGADFVVVLAEQNSPSNLFGSFLAGLGMYRPVSKVYVVQIANGKFVARKRLVRATDSFRWSAVAFEDTDHAAK